MGPMKAYLIPIPSFITTSISCGDTIPSLDTVDVQQAQGRGSGGDTAPDKSPAFVEESVLHPVEDEAGQLAGQGDGALAHLLHEGAGVGLHLLAGPGGGHQLHHGGVVGRVAGVRHDELRAVRHEVRDLARH